MCLKQRQVCMPIQTDLLKPGSYILLLFLDNLESFMTSDSLIAITSKVLLVALSKYSRSSKCSFKQEFMWNKETEFGLI